MANHQKMVPLQKKGPQQMDRRWVINAILFLVRTGCVDSQTVKTTESGGERGYDGGKKINGRKRHIIVDTLGLIMAMVIHTADIQDYDGAKLVFQEPGDSFKRLKVIFADSAYGKMGLPNWVMDMCGLILQTVLRPVGVKGFVVLPKRWIVERTFAWINKYR
jgi:putative transposase